MPRGVKLHEFIADWEIALMVEDNGMSYPEICEYLKETYDVSFHPETIGLHYRKWKEENREKCLNCGEIFISFFNFRDDSFCSYACKMIYEKEMKEKHEDTLEAIQKELHTPWYIRIWEKLVNTLRWS